MQTNTGKAHTVGTAMRQLPTPEQLHSQLIGMSQQLISHKVFDAAQRRER